MAGVVVTIDFFEFVGKVIVKSSLSQEFTFRFSKAQVRGYDINFFITGPPIEKALKELLEE